MDNYELFNIASYLVPETVTKVFTKYGAGTVWIVDAILLAWMPSRD